MVPVTVKDSKGNRYRGLTWRDFTVYENNVREPLRVFSVDPRPISVAFVIDQTLPSNYMREVNESMNAIQGALTPYDEAAVFTYTNGAKEWTGFTGAQGNRLPAVLSLAQATGTDPMVPNVGGSPMSEACASLSERQLRRPEPAAREVNPADLRSHRSQGDSHPQRRDSPCGQGAFHASQGSAAVIFVISDGKEYGSKATWKEVVKYLQTNNIAVYATLVGESARWGEGWLDRFHSPSRRTTTSSTST
jgi:hypothetical protein